MAGEIYIARQDTLEAVQGTVEGIDTKADTTINTLGNFAGGGIEDTVAAKLEALTGNVAQLQETVNTLINSGSGVIKHRQVVSFYNSSASQKSVSENLTGFTNIDKMVFFYQGGDTGAYVTFTRTAATAELPSKTAIKGTIVEFY